MKTSNPDPLNATWERIDSVDKLLASEWGTVAQDEATVKRNLTKAEKLAPKLKNTKLQGRVATATQMLRKFFQKKDGFSARNALILGAAITYFVMPLDAIPDFLPVVGLLDDLGVLGIAISAISGMVGRGKGEDGVCEGAEIPTPGAEDEEFFQNMQQVALDTKPATKLRKDLHKQLDELLKEAEELEDEALLAEGADLQAVALDPLRRVIVTGLYNAGKSSLINRLLAGDSLPVGITPTTAKLTTVVHGKTLMAVVNGKDGSIQTTSDPAILRDARHPFYQYADEVLIHHPGTLLETGLCLVDTPGLSDSADRSKGFALDFDALPRSDAFLYVKGMDVADFSADELTFLSTVAGHISPDQIIVVLSKTDIIDIDDEHEMDRIEQSLRRTLMQYGLSRVPFFRVRRDAGPGDMLPDLEAELRRRANKSLESVRDQAVQEATEAMRDSVERTKALRAELARLSAAELAARKEKLARKKERVNEIFARRADTLKRTSQGGLHSFLFEQLYPKACQFIDDNPVSEKTVAALSSTIHSALGTYLDARCPELMEHLGVSLNEDERARVLASSSGGTLQAPQLAGTGEYAKYLLPSIAIISFFPMGIFAWLTTVAAPTFLMDSLGVGKGLKQFLSALENNSARKELKNKVRDSLAQLEQDVMASLSKLIDSGASRAALSCAKELELSLN